MLSLKVGSNTDIFNFISRIFDYYTLNFLPKDPSVFMVFERNDLDIFDENLQKKYIYMNIKNFGQDNYRRLYLEGP